MNKLSIIVTIYKNENNIIPFYEDFNNNIAPYLDDYEIIEGETKTAQLIAYLDTPTNIDVLKPRFTMPSWHYEDGAIFFNDWNAFSK